MNPLVSSVSSVNLGRVLITGGAGFVGSHLAESLLRSGHDVTLLDLLTTGSSKNLETIRDHPRLSFHQGSMLDKPLVDRLVKDSDTIFHMAAAVGVQLVLKQPLYTLQANIQGTESILEAASQYGKKILIASTSEVYGKSEKLPFSEDDDITLGPTSKARWGYAASKMVDEFLALAYHQETNLPVVIFRLFNTVGPRQTGAYGMVLPRLITQALQKEPLTIYGNGEQTRCFCDVQDAVKGILLLADKPEAIGQVFNIGSTEEVSLNVLAKKILEQTKRFLDNGGSEGRVTYLDYKKVYPSGFEEILHRRPNVEKIKQLVGWEPKTTIDEIIERMVYFLKKERR